MKILNPKTFNSKVIFSLLCATGTVSMSPFALAQSTGVKSLSSNSGSTRAEASKTPREVSQKAGLTKAVTLGTTRKTPNFDPKGPAQGAGTSVVTQNRPQWADKLSLFYIADMFGPAVGRVSSYQTNSNTGAIDRRTPINALNIFGVGYRISPLSRISVNQSMTYVPVGNDSVTLGDTMLAVNRTLVQNGRLTLTGELREYLPTSNGAQNDNTILRTRAVMVGQYAPKDSRWSFATTGYAQHWLYGSEADTGQSRLKLMLEPAVNYRIGANLSAGLYYNMYALNSYNTSVFNFTPSTELHPNMSWDVNSRFNLTPYLTIPTGNRVALDTTTFNLQLSLQML
jgi:hypothetical protein